MGRVVRGFRGVDRAVMTCRNLGFAYLNYLIDHSPTPEFL